VLPHALHVQDGVCHYLEVSFTFFYQSHWLVFLLFVSSFSRQNSGKKLTNASGGSNPPPRPTRPSRRNKKTAAQATEAKPQGMIFLDCTYPRFLFFRLNDPMSRCRCRRGESGCFPQPLAGNVNPAWKREGGLGGGGRGGQDEQTHFTQVVGHPAFFIGKE
jgi:hypothetical protein